VASGTYQGSCPWEKKPAEEQSLAGSLGWPLDPVAAVDPAGTEVQAVAASAQETDTEHNRWSSLVAAGQVQAAAAAAFQGEAAQSGECLAAEGGGEQHWPEEPGVGSESREVEAKMLSGRLAGFVVVAVEAILDILGIRDIAVAVVVAAAAVEDVEVVAAATVERTSQQPNLSVRS
jgi:hypothetical protein